MGIKHFKLGNWCKKFQRLVGKLSQKFLNWKIGFKKLVISVKHFQCENQC